MTLQEIRDERVAVMLKLDELDSGRVDKETSEKRSYTKEEISEFDTLKTQADQLELDIRTGERGVVLDEMRSKEIAPPPAAPPNPQSKPDPPSPRIDPVYHGEIRGFGVGVEAGRAAFKAGTWVKDLLIGNTSDQRFVLENPSLRAMNSTTNSAGGFVVDSEMMTAIINLKEVFGVFRQRANVVPMTKETAEFPRRITGTSSFYIPQNTAPTESEPTFDMISLVSRILGQLTRIPESLVEDAVIDIAAFVAAEFAQEFSDAEDQAGFLGTGLSATGGIVGLPKLTDGDHAGSVFALPAGSLAFSDITNDDLQNALAQLPQYAADEPDLAWYISRVGHYATFVRLATAAGGNTKDNIEGGTGLQYEGIPIVISQKLNAVTSNTAFTAKAYIGSLRQTAMFGDRKTMTMRVLNERFADTLQIGVLGVQRYDINVHEAGSPTVAGSMIAIQTPAS